MDWERMSTGAECVGNALPCPDATKGLADFPYLAESSRRRLAVLRRCPTPLIVLAAVLAFALGSRPMSTQADSLTSNSTTANTTTEALEYTLTTTQAIAPVSGSPPAPGSTAPTPQFVGVVSVPSIVQPPSTNDPVLQIFSDSTGFYFNNPKQLSPEIGNNPDNGTAITSQALGLSFYGQGLPANGSLTFSLPFAQSALGGNPPTTIPQFTMYNPAVSLTQPISFIQIKYDGIVPATGSGSGTGTGTGTVTIQAETPEPLSLLVWTALAGIGLWRARTRGRRSSG